MKKRFSEERIVGFLRDARLEFKTVKQLSREHGFGPNSFYVWKRKYGAMEEPDVKRPRELEKENLDFPTIGGRGESNHARVECSHRISGRKYRPASLT